jgi:SET domain-containing protein
MVPYVRYCEFYTHFANKKNSEGRFTLYSCTPIKYLIIVNDKIINSSAYVSAREVKCF